MRMRPAKFVGVAWTALILGIVGVCLIPVPFFNNAILAVASESSGGETHG